MVTSILAQVETKVQPLSRTDISMSYNAMLDIGQTYEKALAALLTASGLSARQTQQRFISSTRLRRYRRTRKDEHLTAQRSLFRTHQVDIIYRVPGTLKNRIVELKALTPAAFRADKVHIGLQGKYDQKEIRVHEVMLINQETGEVWVCPPKRLWHLEPAIYDFHQSDYAVSRSDLTPFNTWIAQKHIEYGLDTLA